MSRKLTKSRETIWSGSKLEKRLAAYVAAIGVAGAGILAGPPTAEAKVVYRWEESELAAGFLK